MLQSGTESITGDVASVWEKGYTGKNIIVAVVDDGLKYTHEEFRGRYVSKIISTIMWNARAAFYHHDVTWGNFCCKVQCSRQI